MKKKIFYTIALLSIFLFAACGRHAFDQIDTTPPAPPTGLQVMNGDNRVDLSWNPNHERDLAGYNVYYAYSYDGKYTLLGSTQNAYYTDYGAKNGDTYYYAVTAYDNNGNESDLSYENASATPRPEGFNASIFDYRNFPSTGGYSFTTFTAVPYDDKSADFFFENYNGAFYLDVWSDSDIQDMGPTTDIYDIPYAPTTGWSATKDAVAIIGHTYVIWTWDNRYAKVRISNITNERVVFDWAFQTVAGNTQLKPKAYPAVRGTLDPKTLNRK